MQFSGKTVLVTGAASGIGRATAIAFAKAGAKVVLSDISEEVQTVAARIQEGGGQAIAKTCDLADWSSVASLVAAATAKYGTLNCAVNSAGIAGPISLPTHEYPFEAWHQQIAVNLTGAWYFLKATTGQMLQNGGGAIVMVASAAGLRGQPENSPYAASKHGVVGLTRTAALEYATQDIRVNCVCPTAIETPMIMQGRRKLAADPIALEAAKNYQAMKRMGQPEEVAAVNLWLCSEQASFITGRALPVDGGALAR